MSYKPYESDGLNLEALIKDMGSNPAPERQSEFKTNLVKALYNANRKIDAGGGGTGSGDMPKATYDPTNVAGDAFDMANMVGTTWPSAASAAYALASGANPLLDVAGSGNLVSAADPNVAGDSVIVIPTDAIFDYPDGTWFEIINVDAALDMTLTATAGCFLNGVSGGSIVVPAGNNRIFLYKYTTNSWYANVIYKDAAEASYQAATITKTSGEAYSVGDKVYLKSDGKFWKTDASAEATAGPVLIGIALTAATGADEATTVLSPGVDYVSSGLTVGSPYYLSETAGEWTTTAPTADDSVIRVIGFATSTTVIRVQPNSTYVTNGPDLLEINNQTGTTYTLVLSDANKYIRMTNAANQVVTVPLSSSVAFPIGTTIDIRGVTKTVTIRGAIGVFLEDVEEEGGNQSDVASLGDGKTVSIVKTNTDAWDVIGGA
jgi:hypothetical protein